MLKAQAGLVMLLMASMASKGQDNGSTARQYYEELYRAGGLDQFADQYACFRDDAVPTFFILGSSEPLKRLIEESGKLNKLPPHLKEGLKKGFLLQVSYNKGLSNGIDYLDIDHTKGEYSDELDLRDSPTSKAVLVTYALRINWQTLRYVLQIRRKGSPTSMAEGVGRCEVVPSGVQQHGHYMTQP